MNRTSLEKTEAILNASKLITRRHECATWVAAMTLLQQQLTVAASEVDQAWTTLGAASAPSASTKRHQDNFSHALKVERLSAISNRISHRRNLVSSVVEVRLSPKTWLKQAKSANDTAIAQLESAFEALSCTVDEANKLLADVAAAPPSARSAAVAARTVQNHIHAMTATVDRRPADVVAYDDFVAIHGAHLEWQQKDHETFLRVVGSVSTVDSCFVAPADQHVPSDVLVQLRSALPSSISDSDIAAHLRLYRDFVALQHKRHVAIEAWKREKNAELDANRALTERRKHELDEEIRRKEIAKEAARQARAAEIRASVQQWQAQRDAAREAAVMSASTELATKVAQRSLSQKMRAVTLHTVLQQSKMSRTVKEAETNRALEKAVAEVSRPTTSDGILQQRWQATLETTLRRKSASEARDIKRVAEQRTQRLNAAAETMRQRKERAMSQCGRDARRRDVTTPTASFSARTASADAPRVSLLRGAAVLTPRDFVCTTVRAPASWRK